MLYIDELDRLNLFQDLELLSVNEQKEFDEIATLARLIGLAPVCLITIIGKQKEWFLAAQGVPAGLSPDQFSLCRSVLAETEEMTVIPDLSKDNQYSTHASVERHPNLRFYAGAPIINRDGKMIGSICLVDYRPSKLTGNQRNALEILAARCLKVLERNKMLTEQRHRMDSNFETLQMIVTQSPHFIFTLDKNLDITFINKMSRFNAGDIINQSMTSLIHPHSRPAFLAACERCFVEEKIITEHFEIVADGNPVRWFQLKICPLKDSHPTVENLLLIAHDKTVQKEQAVRLAEQENRYRDIVENTSDMIVTIDINGHVLFVNRSWLETMGISNAEEVVGKNVFEFIHWDGLESATHIFEMMRNGTEHIQVELDWITRAGEKISSSANIDCGYVDGKIGYQRGIFRNVTHQKHQAQEMLKNQLMLNEAQKVSKTGNLEVNFLTGEVKWSQELYNILEMEGSKPELFISELYQMIHESDQEKSVRYIEASQHKQGPSHLEFRLTTPKGNMKYIDCNGAPFLTQDGKVTVMLFTLQDITELRQFDKKVFTAAVESEEKERTRMAGELHDGVCQYLASAGLMLDALNDKLQDLPWAPANSHVKQLLDLSRGSIREGLNLVRKVSHDLFPLEFYKSGLIQSVRELVSALNTVSTIRFTLEIRGQYTESDPSVSINLFRIIQEFTRNSQKYSEATEVVIKINSLPEMTKLNISDNGKGFDMDRVAESQKGIGLMSMKKRIESIGGTFNYKSAPGAGVQLRLKVPRNS
ncbi:MAG: PAS domain S-box protein [Chitinophagaceae bacterium]|nr:MAG: PAS domain S-box protein [Chitinophagaceae bacterium]